MNTLSAEKKLAVVASLVGGDRVEELLNYLGSLSGLLEDLTLRVIALENTLPPKDRQRYDKELANLRGRGGVTNGAVGLEVLRSKLLPDQS